MLQILNAADLADIGFKPEWNSDPQLMGIYFMLLIIWNNVLVYSCAALPASSNVFCADWVLPVDGDELKVRCRYCKRVLNAKYLQLLRHSLSNKHLSSAAAVTSLSFPIDVDSCKAADTSAHLSQDEEMVADVEDERIIVVGDESMDVDLRSSNVQHVDDDVPFAADTVDYQVHGHGQVVIALHTSCLMFMIFDSTLNLELLTCMMKAIFLTKNKFS